MDAGLTPQAKNRGNARLVVCNCVATAVLATAVFTLPLQFELSAGNTSEVGVVQPLQVHINRKFHVRSHPPREEGRSITQKPREERNSERENKQVVTTQKVAPIGTQVPGEEVEKIDKSARAKDWHRLLLTSAEKTVAASTDNSYVDFSRLPREDSVIRGGRSTYHSESEAGLELPGQLVFAECPPNASLSDSMRDRCLRWCDPWPSKTLLFTKNDLIN